MPLKQSAPLKIFRRNAVHFLIDKVQRGHHRASALCILSRIL